MRISDWSSDVCSSDLTNSPSGPNWPNAVRNSGVIVRARYSLRPRTERGHFGRQFLHSLDQRADQFVISDRQHVITALDAVILQAAEIIARSGHFLSDQTMMEARALFRSEEHTSELQS